MKATKVGLFAILLLAAEAGVAQAAWNNVFQATLFGRHGSTSQRVVVAQSSPVVVSHSAPVAATDPCCAPTQQCTTKYVQRTYYQPVTTYQSKSYYEQVTNYQTSYYYEPVCSYRYACQYDPCTCSYQQVAVPTTSYQLRSQCCPVTSWVQRCAYEPVTSYRQACYYEPVTTCCQTQCTTTTGAPVTNIPQQSYSAPIVTEQHSGAGPVITEQRSSSPPVVDIPAPPANNIIVPAVPEGSGTRYKKPSYDRSYFPNVSNKQPAPASTWQPRTVPAAKPITPPAPAVKLDRIVVGPDALVEGQVVRNDNTPRPNTVITFVSSTNTTAMQKVTSNYAGRFRVTLTSGSWLVYFDNPDGTRSYHSRVQVDGQRPPHFTLVSRSR